MKAVALLILLFSTGIAEAQTLRVHSVNVQEHHDFPKTIRFFCTQKYPRHECARDVTTLLLILRRYPVGNLGPWNFALVSSDEWRNLVTSVGLTAGSPAFSVLDNRTTVLEEALFSSSGRRRAELIRMFGTVDSSLLEQAVAHELGHVLCGEANEDRAARNGQDLFAARALTCLENKQCMHAEARCH
jgi:hypothetical protein